MPDISVNCLSGLGNRRKNATRSLIAAMPSNCPRMIIVGTLICAGSTTGSSKLPVVDPAQINVPTMIMRGQFDGIAAMSDLVAFFLRLPNPDKQFTLMSGISHASFQQKNYRMVYHILHTFFTQPAPAYTASDH